MTNPVPDNAVRFYLTIRDSTQTASIQRTEYICNFAGKDPEAQIDLVTAAVRDLIYSDLNAWKAQRR